MKRTTPVNLVFQRHYAALFCSHVIHRQKSKHAQNTVTSTVVEEKSCGTRKRAAISTNKVTRTLGTEFYSLSADPCCSGTNNPSYLLQPLTYLAGIVLPICSGQPRHQMLRVRIRYCRPSVAKPVKFADLCLAFGAPAPEGRSLESADKRDRTG